MHSNKDNKPDYNNMKLYIYTQDINDNNGK